MFTDIIACLLCHNVERLSQSCHSAIFYINSDASLPVLKKELVLTGFENKVLRRVFVTITMIDFLDIFYLKQCFETKLCFCPQVKSLLSWTQSI
jgi:hypothetical protein